MFRETQGSKPVVVTVALYNMSLGKSEDTECENVVVYAPDVCVGDQLNNIGFVVASARIQQRFSGRDQVEKAVSVVLADRVLMRFPIEGEFCIFIAFPLCEETFSAKEWHGVELSMVSAMEAVVRLSYRCFVLQYGTVQSAYDCLRQGVDDRGLPGWDRMRQAATFFFYRTLVRPTMDDVRRTIVDHAAPFTMGGGMRMVSHTAAQHLALGSRIGHIAAPHRASLRGMTLVGVGGHLIASTIDRDDTEAILHLVRRRIADDPYNRDAEGNFGELERFIAESKSADDEHPLLVLLRMSQRAPHHEAPSFLPPRARIMGKSVGVLESPIAPAHHLFLFVAPSTAEGGALTVDDDAGRAMGGILSKLRSSAEGAGGGASSDIGALAFHYQNVVAHTSKSTIRNASSASEGGSLFRSDRAAVRNLEVLRNDALVHEQVMSLWKWSPRWSAALWKHMGRELSVVLPQQDGQTAARQVARLPDHVFQEMFRPTL